MIDKNGKIEWKSECGNYYIENWQGRRFLHVKGHSSPKAEQINKSGDVLDWLKKKIKERQKSTSNYVDKLCDQLESAEKEANFWKQIEKDLKIFDKKSKIVKEKVQK